MHPEFSQQCCDTGQYLALGQSCSENLKDCWHDLRPIGAAFYFSLPFRFGVLPEWIIVLNAILIILAMGIGLRAMTELCRTTRASRAALALALLLAHGFFMSGTIRNALSDGPSACAVMLSMWTLVLAMKRRKLWLHALAGGALGLAVIVRSFYLYPALIAAACVVLLALANKQSRLPAALYCVALAGPILAQFSATHARVHSWSFIDPGTAASAEKLHFQTDAYGYDTLMPAKGYYYRSRQCFGNVSNMEEAIREHAWGDALCLIKEREWFYFGSYVSAGRTYLSRPEERHFSLGFLLANGLAVLVAAWWAFAQRDRARLLIVPTVFYGASLAEASLIIPESRFVMAVHVVLWMFASAGIHDLVLRYSSVADAHGARTF